jgi:long-subunit acyl-CoA synthetase (AMP-forming)
VKASFGGIIRIMASGSASMNPEALAFLKMIMCCPFIEAYGQTDDLAAVIFGRAYDTQYG